MSVLDAYALIAALADEPARAEVEQAMLAAPAAVSTTNVVEVVDVLVRLHRRTAVEVDERLDLLERWGALEVIELDREVARDAGKIRAEHYHRSRAPISLADSVALALARSRAEAIATSDGPLAKVARALSVEVIALPDSRGRRP